MLTQIDIRDLATIEALTLVLHRHCTMITGETGAGKSVFIEAIELALGGRASANLIRPGKEKAEISLCFEISQFPKVIDRLQALDLLTEGNECLIRRVITSDGRSRSYVNGTPATLQLVKELGALLFHLHGQHEQQVLLQSDTQRDMLDRYADALQLAGQVRHVAETWRQLTSQIESIQTKSAERLQRCDYLRFQLDELTALRLQPGEWETLEAEHHRLTHAEELMRHIQQSLNLLSDNENQGLLPLLTDLRKQLESIQPVEPKAKNWLAATESTHIQLSDLESDLQTYLNSTQLDPERLQTIEERVGLIFNLARKHKVQPAELVQLQLQLEAEFNELNTSDELLAQLQLEQQQIETNYQRHATQLTEIRKQAASRLEKEITTTIRSLSLPHGEFSIALENDTTPLSPHGNEKIIFLIKTNPDQHLQPLNKVISGGELSRLSLAAHLALAARTTIPTLVFDEVDTGLSGATAEKIGRLLKKLGNAYQVFCVTHQPQVAACGHHHVLVEKYFIDNTTHTRLRLLDEKEKTAEIARMLGGEKITKKTLEHAREVLLGSGTG